MQPTGIEWELQQQTHARLYPSELAEEGINMEEGANMSLRLFMAELRSHGWNTELAFLEEEEGPLRLGLGERSN
jgi:hypothetical protein